MSRDLLLLLEPGFADPKHPDDAQTLGEKRFVTDTNRILALLAERHGFPKVH